MPRRGATAEDDGWILMLVNNAESQRTDLCIVDAQKIAEGGFCCRAEAACCLLSTIAAAEACSQATLLAGPINVSTSQPD